MVAAEPATRTVILEPLGRAEGHSYRRAMRANNGVVATLSSLLERWPDLTGAAIVGLDLRDVPLDLSVAVVDGAVFLGCAFPPGTAEKLEAMGAATVSRLGNVPFPVYRSSLYTPDELAAGHENGLEATLDARITTWFNSSSTTSLPDLVVRALHDATIEAAVGRFVLGRRVVGVMGGHALSRTNPLYRRVALLGRELTRRGFTVATGGGPGVMEAANLGAWCAPMDDGVLDQALRVLSGAPRYPADRAGFVRRALEVRTMFPAGGVSLGVPTWVYADEPTGWFASHIAKYFTNSVREDGLLAIARSGVVYAPGGAGTEQEIFTDTAQNSLTLYGVRSPMVFYGSTYFDARRPELLTAVRQQAAAFGWDDLIALCDDVSEAVDFIEEHDPDAAGAAGVERRRTHRDP